MDNYTTFYISGGLYEKICIYTTEAKFAEYQAYGFKDNLANLMLTISEKVKDDTGYIVRFIMDPDEN